MNELNTCNRELSCQISVFRCLQEHTISKREFLLVLSDNNDDNCDYHSVRHSYNSLTGLPCSYHGEITLSLPARQGWAGTCTTGVYTSHLGRDTKVKERIWPQPWQNGHALHVSSKPDPAETSFSTVSAAPEAGPPFLRAASSLKTFHAIIRRRIGSRLEV